MGKEISVLPSTTERRAPSDPELNDEEKAVTLSRKDKPTFLPHLGESILGRNSAEGS